MKIYPLPITYGVPPVTESPDGKTVAVARGSNEISIIDNKINEDSNILKPDYLIKTEKNITNIALSEKGNFLLVGTVGDTVLLYGRLGVSSSWTLEKEIVLEGEAIHDVAFIQTDKNETTLSVLSSVDGQLVHRNCVVGDEVCIINRLELLEFRSDVKYPNGFYPKIVYSDLSNVIISCGTLVDSKFMMWIGSVWKYSLNDDEPKAVNLHSTDPERAKVLSDRVSLKVQYDWSSDSLFVFDSVTIPKLYVYNYLEETITKEFTLHAEELVGSIGSRVINSEDFFYLNDMIVHGNGRYLTASISEEMVFEGEGEEKLLSLYPFKAVTFILKDLGKENFSIKLYSKQTFYDMNGEMLFIYALAGNEKNQNISAVAGLPTKRFGTIENNLVIT